MNKISIILLTEAGESLFQLILVDEPWVVTVVSAEDVLPVGDVLPYASKLVKVHSTFVIAVEHGWAIAEEKERDERAFIVRAVSLFSLSV